MSIFVEWWATTDLAGGHETTCWLLCGGVNENKVQVAAQQRTERFNVQTPPHFEKLCTHK